MNDIHTF